MNCYNGERFVREAIASVFAQTFQDWEIIFWDNASTDSTPEIAGEFTSDPRFRQFRAAKNVPLGHARKLAMAQARGDWIGFVDHDDTCLPQRLELQLAAVAKGDYSVCYGGLRNVSENGSTISEWLPKYPSGWTLGRHLIRFEANLPTMLLNARYLERYGIVLDETYETAEDYDLFMRLAAKGQVCVVPQLLATYRVYQASLTERRLGEAARERRMTHAVLREDPQISRTYAREFSEAERKDIYYEAWCDMYERQYRRARYRLETIRDASLLYFLLWLVSYWPGLWNFLHNRALKTWIITRILGM
jgi:glycosyltransferase involved in cell wall biosynthesis